MPTVQVNSIQRREINVCLSTGLSEGGIARHVDRERSRIGREIEHISIKGTQDPRRKKSGRSLVTAMKGTPALYSPIGGSAPIGRCRTRAKL